MRLSPKIFYTILIILGMLFNDLLYVIRFMDETKRKELMLVMWSGGNYFLSFLIVDILVLIILFIFYYIVKKMEVKDE